MVKNKIEILKVPDTKKPNYSKNDLIYNKPNLNVYKSQKKP